MKNCQNGDERYENKKIKNKTMMCAHTHNNRTAIDDRKEALIIVSVVILSIITVFRNPPVRGPIFKTIPERIGMISDRNIVVCSWAVFDENKKSVQVILDRFVSSLDIAIA